MTSALVTPKQLSEMKDAKILDASYGQMWTPLTQMIEGAQFFDIDKVADPKSPLAHMLPPAEIFAEKVGQLGISEKDTVVIYDRAGIAMAASRAWWMFRCMGHEKVFVLDGGLPKWKDEGYPLVRTASKPVPTTYKAAYKPELFRSLEQMVQNVTSKKETIVDARAAPRFQTSEGHIPGSYNVPFMDLIAADGTLKKPAETRRMFEGAGVSLSKPLTATCGSGVTACVLALALHELGRPDVAVYNGSWTEWKQNPQTPKATAA